jgi:hypothetical protein
MRPLNYQHFTKAPPILKRPQGVGSPDVVLVIDLDFLLPALCQSPAFDRLCILLGILFPPLHFEKASPTLEPSAKELERELRQ